MPDSNEETTRWLRRFLEEHDGVAGSVHLRASDNLLRLAASVNLPPPVVDLTQQIPKGKGMAGLAWERDEAVSTCNLVDDETGDVRPGAKAVGAKAAVAVPIHDSDGLVRGVVGIAYAGPRDLGSGELAKVTRAAETFPG